MAEVDMLKATITQLIATIEEMMRREDMSKCGIVNNLPYIDKIKEAMINEKIKYGTLIEEGKRWHDKEIKIMKDEFEKLQTENNLLKNSLEKLLNSSIEFRRKYDELMIVSNGIKDKFISVESENKLLKHKLRETDEMLSFFTRDLNEFLTKGFQKLSETIGKTHQTNSFLSHDQTIQTSTNQINPVLHDQTSQISTNQINATSAEFLLICQLPPKSNLSNGCITHDKEVQNSFFPNNIKCQICQQEFQSTESMLEHARLCDLW